MAKTRLLVLAASLIGGAVTSYYFGFDSVRNATRTMEAGQDVLAPVDDVRRTRIRRESIRTMLAEVATEQATRHAATLSFPTLTNIAFDREKYVLETYASTVCPRPHGAGCLREEAWMAVARHKTSPMGEVCAVALNVEPAYVSGIVLKREGRIRCSWDVATRINRVIRLGT
jgi:hypothetical protein